MSTRRIARRRAHRMRQGFMVVHSRWLPGGSYGTDTPKRWSDWRHRKGVYSELHTWMGDA